MKPNQTGFICCLVLAVVTALILFVESKRPIHVEITMDEIHEEMCNGEKDNKEETNVQEQSIQTPQTKVKSEDY
jgi:hypothetical protein